MSPNIDSYMKLMFAKDRQIMQISADKGEDVLEKLNELRGRKLFVLISRANATLLGYVLDLREEYLAKKVRVRKKKQMIDLVKFLINRISIEASELSPKYVIIYRTNDLVPRVKRIPFIMVERMMWGILISGLRFTPFRYILVTEEGSPPSRDLYWYVDAYLRTKPLEVVL